MYKSLAPKKKKKSKKIKYIQILTVSFVINHKYNQKINVSTGAYLSSHLNSVTYSTNDSDTYGITSSVK
jgi:hypothetical protein